MLNRQNRYGLTALHIAASHGHLEVVVLLCQQCAHGNALDCLGDTPLHKAALKGHLDVVKFLCENGVMVHSRNKNGKLPIDYARQNGHQSVVRFLESVDTRFEPRQDFSLLDQTKSFYFDD
jgi:ankyrin repeat protein